MLKIVISLLPSGSPALGRTHRKSIAHIDRFTVYPADDHGGFAPGNPLPLGQEYLSRPGHMFSAARADGTTINVSPSIWTSATGEHVVVLAGQTATRTQIIDAARTAFRLRETYPAPT